MLRPIEQDLISFLADPFKVDLYHMIGFLAHNHRIMTVYIETTRYKEYLERNVQAAISNYTWAVHEKNLAHNQIDWFEAALKAENKVKDAVLRFAAAQDELQATTTFWLVFHRAELRSELGFTDPCDDEFDPSYIKSDDLTPFIGRRSF